ncbi:MAG TPA: helix-turn-helix domain-containing protein [Pirellulales bacterium]|nr:helix-turn-helix domain-containing protein [Pirellulales bacterium]
MPKKTFSSRVAQDLIEGMQGFAEHLRQGGAIETKYTVRHVDLDLHPRSYTADDVQRVRELLRVSQTLFARFLGVSVKTVHAWESGKAPSEIACRFMDEIQQQPGYWQARIQELIKVKAVPAAAAPGRKTSAKRTAGGTASRRAS